MNVTALKIINIPNSLILLHNEALHFILVMHLLKLDTDIKTTNVLVDLIAYVHKDIHVYHEVLQ